MKLLAGICAAAAFAYAAPLSGLGWNQGSHFGLVKSLSQGTARIDEHRWMTRDVAYVDGHLYSNKAPGLALASLPAYSAIRASGVEATISHRAGSRWLGTRITVWAVSLWSVVLPAALLLVLVGSVAERIEPGLGPIVAATLGFGTLVLPFATVFFAHTLSALLGFSAFVVLWRERERPPRRLLLFTAGALAGLAITVEYTLVIVALVLGVYAITRSGRRVSRALSFIAGVVLGAAPILVYNRLAFGSVFHISYANAVRPGGVTGHDVPINDEGVFGVAVPSPRVALELLFASRGLLTVAPVLALSALGLVLLHRRGMRAEACVISVVAALMLTMNAAYEIPFGGVTAGPRFLVPALPFLAVALSPAYRRLPATTCALATVSVTMLLTATATIPLLRDGDTSVWPRMLLSGDFRETITSPVGVPDGVGIGLFLVPAACAIVLAILATARAELLGTDGRVAAAALGFWVLVAAIVPQIGVSPGVYWIGLVACAAAFGGVAALLVVRQTGCRAVESAP
jgi:hypothetical protein